MIYSLFDNLTPARSERYVYNAVGHAVLLVDGGCVPVQVNLYEAFGGIEASWGNSKNNRLANTKERDASITLDNHGFRYYDASIGRYISNDPIGYEGGFNLYVHCTNDPVNKFDPLGLKDDDEEKKRKEFRDKKTREILETTSEAIEKMEKDNWKPQNNNNPGEFGSATDKKVSDKLKTKEGWATDVWIDTETKKVLKVGDIKDEKLGELSRIKGRVAQIDAIALEDGYSPEVGKQLDTKRAHGFELKTSLNGDMSEDQRVKYKKIFGNEGYTKIQSTKGYGEVTVDGKKTYGFRDNKMNKMQAKLWGKIAKSLPVVSSLVSLYAIANHAEYDNELKVVQDKFKDVQRYANSSDKASAMAATIEAGAALSSYFQRFDPSGFSSGINYLSTIASLDTLDKK